MMNALKEADRQTVERAAWEAEVYERTVAGHDQLSEELAGSRTVATSRRLGPDTCDQRIVAPAP